MEITIGNGHDAEVKVCLLFQHMSLDSLPIAQQPHMKKAGELTWFFGREGEPHTLVAGLGERNEFRLETLREAAGAAGRAVEKEKFSKVHVSLNEITQAAADHGMTEQDMAAAWVEGWLLGTYAFDTYLSEKRESSVSLLSLAGEDDRGLAAAVQTGKTRAQGTVFSRDLCNEPPNVMRPQVLAERLAERFAPTEVAVTVFEGDALKEHEMHGLMAVGKGSKHAPVFIEARYTTDASAPLIALVGKGMTFDTGGISLKKGRNISDMRMDMGGAAAVAGALDILTHMDVPVNVAVLIPSAENMPDGGALLPGEVIRFANGVSVQVGNTDAEGRLILADALIRAQVLGAETVVDIATLTGACAQALGPEMAGVWGDDNLLAVMRDLGERSGDRVWPMPLIEQYDDLLKSTYADTQNITNVSYGGAITAALFLRKFVDPASSWAHIDMAGTMEHKKTKGYAVEGASGFGARLLADFVMTKSRET